ncbi:unnamed protein product [Meganyctiphanes norvegica]|uniref:Uncharacterized protein n=1 Tax=Meganyctiphanes norvegica TaxID=48144 RepID=A0AAV2SKQ2_MEGNR
MVRDDSPFLHFGKKKIICASSDNNISKYSKMLFKLTTNITTLSIITNSSSNTTATVTTNIIPTITSSMALPLTTSQIIATTTYTTITITIIITFHSLVTINTPTRPLPISPPALLLPPMPSPPLQSTKPIAQTT